MQPRTGSRLHSMIAAPRNRPELWPSTAKPPFHRSHLPIRASWATVSRDFAFCFASLGFVGKIEVQWTCKD